MSTEHEMHAHNDNDSVGGHGMLLFGEEEIYFSHLPMFHSPHHFQVLLEVRLDDAGAKALAADRRAGAADIYTFDPDVFALAELDPDAQKRTSITGAVVHGHFERGGTQIATGVTAEVARVVYFQKLDVNARRPDTELMNYLCFGQPGRLFLAHQILGRPSFDQVNSVRLVPGTATDLAGRPIDVDVTTLGFDPTQPVKVGRRELAEVPLAPGEVAKVTFFQSGALGTHGFGVDLQVVKQLDLERNELR